MTISQETRDLARELYVIDGLTFEQVAERTKVSVANLKRWARSENWQRRREGYRKDKEGLRGSLAELRDSLLEKALENLDPQYAYAVVAIEKLLGSKTKQTGEPEVPDKPMTKEEFLKFLKEKVYGL